MSTPKLEMVGRRYRGPPREGTEAVVKLLLATGKVITLK
jgi:hypothetical protein